jgi:transposase InsO family protein
VQIIEHLGDSVVRPRQAAGHILALAIASSANAVSERFVGTIRRECLDRLLILGRRHIEAALAECGDHYKRHRPHRSLDHRCPSEVTEATAPITDPDPAGI